MDWIWHIVLFLFLWFVLADTFYQHCTKLGSFFATVVWYPIVLILSQMFLRG